MQKSSLQVDVWVIVDVAIGSPFSVQGSSAEALYMIASAHLGLHCPCRSRVTEVSAVIACGMYTRALY